MSAAIDVEQCAGCRVVNWCDRWVPDGEWKHRKGVEPCRPVSMIWIDEVGRLSPEKERELFDIISKGDVLTKKTINISAGQRGGKSICYAQENIRPKITEEPIPTARAKSCKGCIAEGTCTPDRVTLCGGKYYCKPAGPVIDAEQEQRAKFSLRSMK